MSERKSKAKFERSHKASASKGLKNSLSAKFYSETIKHVKPISVKEDRKNKRALTTQP